MSRKAFLIESSQLNGEPDLPGARVDVTNLRMFLRSDEGGAWDDEEILTLRKPSWTFLQALLNAERTTDYVFMTFSGHGYHVKGKDLDESRICLTENDEVPVASINPGNPRCTFVIDACRQLILEKSLTEVIAAKEMSRIAAYQDRQAYRRLFDATVAQGEKGIIRMFSCDIDEAAGESRLSGGYYTEALMKCCRDWDTATESGRRNYYSVWQAHSCAATRATHRAFQQHPQYDGGRRNTCFPLAVKP